MPKMQHSYVGKPDFLNMLKLTLKTSAITQHLLNCSDAFYLANLNAFPNLDSSEEFPDKIHCPTSLVYTNSKILFSCKYNSPNQLVILEALLIKRKMPELNCDSKLANNYPYFCNTSWAHAFLQCASLDWLTTSCED